MFRDGVPTMDDLAGAMAGELYQGIEKFSDEFLRENDKTLRKYYWPKWSKDPFHEWSRRWEYPWVMSRVKDDSGRVLDAGAGITFMPWMLLKSKAWDVDACDADPYFKYAYKEIGGGVKYHVCDIAKMPLEANSFDAVYCISVLEHTENYGAILREFKRVLKPGGQLLVTFDIDLNSNFEREKGILREVSKVFGGEYEWCDDFSDKLTTVNTGVNIRPLSVYCLEAVKHV